ncbi:MAG TPA: amidase, partial [Terriglobales bacterium]
MSKSRRDFLISSSTAIIFNTFVTLTGAAVAPKLEAQTQTPPPAGTPPVFGVAPAVGPEVSAATFADAEKLVQVELNDRDRAQVAQNWRSSMAPVYERRTGPRKVAIPESVAPYSQVNPVLPGHQAGPASNRFVRSDVDPGPLPANDADIAFAPVWQLSRWIESRKLSSERLTNIYLARIARFDPKLRC